VAGRSIAVWHCGVAKMQNDALLQDTSRLSYLDASKVTSPAGVLAGLDVLTAEGRRLGSVEGVVIDAAARRVRYLAVQSSGWFRPQRYLVGADQLAQLEGGRKALRLRGDIRDEAVLGLDATALRKFSDEDLLDAMFASRAA
jgi:PRC-barrel domain